MSKIENSKTYLDKEMENIFFRPSFTGDGAQELGIRVLFNMPAPTRLHFWHRPDEVLHKYSAAGWSGSTSPERYVKTITLQRVKAEMAYSADEYFSLVCEGLAQSELTSLDDLTGTALEAAETALFRDAVAENIRATMWLGKASRAAGLNTFDGLLQRILTDLDSESIPSEEYETLSSADVEERLEAVWLNAYDDLRRMRAEGNLAFFVTTDVYEAYADSLDAKDYEAAFLTRQNGHDTLRYKGIPLVDMRIGEYMGKYSDLGSSFILLTDRRNLALALSTNQMPGSEVRMWYNPDLMENRQRAIFMAGCDYLLPELVSISYSK